VTTSTPQGRCALQSWICKWWCGIIQDACQKDT